MTSTTRPRYFVNILRSDTGFAPNPFHGVCTLACCRPPIRRCAKKGDWVIGVTPKELGNNIAYAMKITEDPLAFAEYFHDRRFAAKKPTRSSGRYVDSLGDNCYEPLPGGDFRQLPCMHSDDINGREDKGLKEWDLSGTYVLVSNEFAYFGAEPRPLDKRKYEFMVPARYNRVNFTAAQEVLLADLVAGLVRQGTRIVYARPRNWRGDDNSWQGRKRPCR